MTDGIILFDRRALRQHRSRAARLCGVNDFLRREVSNKLVERLGDVKRNFDIALDLGGALTGTKGSSAATRIITGDLSTTRMEVAGNDNPVAMDEELFPFANHSFELITSNLTMHWINDLPGALAQIQRVLMPDGLFLAAILGGDTLFELRHAFIEAETDTVHRTTPHTSPMIKVAEAGALLQRAGFAMPVVDIDTLTFTYENMFSLMRDLRCMGETNAVLARDRHFLRRDILFSAANYYKDYYAAEDGRIPATFQVIWLTGWAPHKDQQKALAPGSAKNRLADVLYSNETPAGEKADPSKRTSRRR